MTPSAPSHLRSVRILRLLWAILRCDTYLITRGMWRGECRFRASDLNGRIVRISAVTGSLWRQTLRETRVFFNQP